MGFIGIQLRHQLQRAVHGMINLDVALAGDAGEMGQRMRFHVGVEDVAATTADLQNLFGRAVFIQVDESPVIHGDE